MRAQMDEKQVDTKAARDEEEARRRRRQRVRALIIGSLAAGGAFQLNGWMAQAHGNRSSKSMIGEFPDVVFTPTVREQIEKEKKSKEKTIKENEDTKKNPTGSGSKPPGEP
jgi:hypothetical protein